VQLCNDSSGAVNIAGWVLSDRINWTLSHAFVSGTSIPANSCLTVINNWNGTGIMPSYFYDLNRNSSIWNNGGDEINITNGTTTSTFIYPAFAGDGRVAEVSGSTSNIITQDYSITPSDLGSSSLPVDLISFEARRVE